MRPVTDLQRKVAPFEVVTDMVPAGDQPAAIAEIEKRVNGGGTRYGPARRDRHRQDRHGGVAGRAARPPGAGHAAE